jgi:hypothetical protein
MGGFSSEQIGHMALRGDFPMTLAPCWSFLTGGQQAPWLPHTPSPGEVHQMHGLVSRRSRAPIDLFRGKISLRSWLGYLIWAAICLIGRRSSPDMSRAGAQNELDLMPGDFSKDDE